MSEFKVASRYAKSLIGLAQEQGNLEAVKTDVEQFVAILKANPELAAVLKNPIIKQDKKKNILNGIFEGKINPLLVSFFDLIIMKGRGNVINGTVQEFVRQYNEVKGIVHATVTSATPLSNEHLEAFRKQIGEQVKADVILSNPIDASLIGGFVVKVGDRQIDASIVGKLNKLERHFQNQGI